MQEKNQTDAQRGGRRAPGVEEAVPRWRLVASLACTGPGWKKKEQIPAEEKESSRLELLV
jgi:hypothetical protein